MTQPKHRLHLELSPTRFAVVRLEAGAAVPDWARAGGWWSATHTPAELSIVCDEGVVPSGTLAQRDLRCLSVHGPLDFGEVGVLEALAGPLARAGVSIFVVSTYDTDHLFVPDASLRRAVEALEEAGHVVQTQGTPPGPTRSP